MTTEEKLQHFYDLSIEAAASDANQLIEEHQAALDRLFLEHKETKLHQSEIELHAESEKLKREFNKEISTKQIQIKRKLSAARDELRDNLFLEVEQKLLDFKKTSDYITMLCRQINQALTFAETDEMTIYLDASDADLIDTLTETINSTSFVPAIADEPLLGGIRAIIRSRNLLIDNSFLTLMQDEKERFELEVRYE